MLNADKVVRVLEGPLTSIISDLGVPRDRLADLDRGFHPRG